MRQLNRQNCCGFSILFLFFVYAMSSSCVSIKKARYFNDIPDSMPSPYTLEHPAVFNDPRIESNDNLAITLQTITQNSSNTPITTNSVGTFSELNGFLVDKNGYINLSLIGPVKVAGLTTMEAKELIEEKASKHYNNPVVNVRIANFDVTVLGDVAKPGKITLPNEKASIIDAIALSGDLPLTANRTNVLLIRNEGDHQKCVRFDLTSSKIFQSPDYWLKQRDIIYVQPNKNKIQNSDNTVIRNLGILSSLISLASLIVVFKSLK